MLNNLSAAVKLLIILGFSAAGAALVFIISGWHSDSVELAEVKPVYTVVFAQRDKLVIDDRELRAQVSDLKLAITQQNAAVELAEARTLAAQQQQALAKEFALQSQKRADDRVAQLQADLADKSKTVTDMLNNSWRKSR